MRSARSASVGRTRRARRTGTHAASVPTPAMNTATAANHAVRTPRPPPWATSGAPRPRPFLSDEQRTVQRDLEIREYTDPEHDPMIPHTILLEPGLVVYRVYMGYWYWGRPTPEELRQDFRLLTRRCRPDWDLAARGLREAWDAGEKQRFYPHEPG